MHAKQQHDSPKEQTLQSVPNVAATLLKSSPRSRWCHVSLLPTTLLPKSLLVSMDHMRADSNTCLGARAAASSGKTTSNRSAVPSTATKCERRAQSSSAARSPVRFVVALICLAPALSARIHRETRGRMTNGETCIQCNGFNDCERHVPCNCETAGRMLTAAGGCESTPSIPRADLQLKFPDAPRAACARIRYQLLRELFFSSSLAVPESGARQDSGIGRLGIGSDTAAGGGGGESEAVGGSRRDAARADAARQEIQ